MRPLCRESPVKLSTCALHKHTTYLKNTTVSCDETPCSLLESMKLRSNFPFFFASRGWKLKPNLSIFYQTTRRHIAEYVIISSYRRPNQWATSACSRYSGGGVNFTTFL
jgi:hypothetical protein